MATHHGNEGIVKIGANTVAEVTAFTVTEQVDVVEDHSMGDTWKSHKTGHKGWSASITCRFDESDTNGQEAMTTGAEVTLNLYPEGDASSDVELTGTATVEERGHNQSYDGIVEQTFSLRGQGALTRGAVS